MKILHDEQTIPSSEQRAARARRIVSFAIGILLVAAAVWAVMGGQNALDELSTRIADAPIHLKLLTVALPILNWTLISISFWLLSRRYGVVRIGEMHALIGSAWLLNYLPMRPGMIGRIAYHKSINSIRVTDSIRITITSVVLTAVAVCTLLCLSLIALDLRSEIAWLVLAAPGIGLLIIGGVIAVRTRSVFSPVAAITLATAVRFFDILTWVARYAVVFALIGEPLTIAQAALVTAVSQVAMMIPLAGNGLGIREWGIGLTVPLASGAASSVGLTADLLNRAAELIVAVPVGLASAGILLHAHQKRTRNQKDLQLGPDPADPSMRID